MNKEFFDQSAREQIQPNEISHLKNYAQLCCHYYDAYPYDMVGEWSS